jgi:predicted O-linked N-acetylglucosamine transferase (SPINDLY family)
MPLFKLRSSAEFELICYSGVPQGDDLTGEFRRAADLWRCTVGLTDGQLAEMILGDRVDILVDLSQHMAGNRLPTFALKPSPIQLSFAGYPESTGTETIGYRISDPYLEGQTKCDGWQIGWKSNSDGTSEQVFLIESFWCYEPGALQIQPTPLPAREQGRVTFGCLNNFCKVNDALLRLWARLLGRVPDSRMMILCGFGSHRQRTVAIFAAEGVASQRLEFVEPQPRSKYLELYHRLDIALDPFPYGGHTTSIEALWMGVPVVSLTGERAVSRAGLSILNNLGLPELVAFSEDEYVRIAVNLANDLPRLAELRRTLRSRMERSVLMDGPRFARQIEAAYRAMWREWCVKAESSPE